nr:unnamed protein product [Callosobruchus chinensis]
MPDLLINQVCERKAENRSFVRHFSRDIYNKNSWICGCEVANLLYCFPCLLCYNPATASVRTKSWAGLE